MKFSIVLGFATGLSLLFPQSLFASHIAGFTWSSPGSATHLAHHTFSSAVMNTDIGYNIYLPPNYNPNNSSVRFPVIYFLHGLNGSEWNYSNSTSANPNNLYNLIQNNSGFKEAIIVIPNGGKALFYVDHPNCSTLKHCPYSMIVNELVSHIDTNYFTIADKQHRAIQGFSMGGQGALLIATENPQLFGSVAALSSACYADIQYGFSVCGDSPTTPASNTIKYRINQAIAANSTPLQSTNFLLSYGQSEIADIKDWQQHLHSLLSAKSIPSQVHILDAGHNLSDQLSDTISNNLPFGQHLLNFHQSVFESSPPQYNLDFNNDFSTNILDFNILLSNFSISNCTHPTDLNSDCLTNILDYQIFVSQYPH